MQVVAVCKHVPRLHPNMQGLTPQLEAVCINNSSLKVVSKQETPREAAQRWLSVCIQPAQAVMANKEGGSGQIEHEEVEVLRELKGTCPSARIECQLLWRSLPPG